MGDLLPMSSGTCELMQEHGCAVIDPRSQVRDFIQGINISYIDSFKDQIISTAYLRTDYNVCISLCKTFIDQINKVSPPEINISGVESSNHKGGGQKKRKGGSGGAVKDVYYSKEEYRAVSSDQRSAL